jgi:hypothetical protein
LLWRRRPSVGAGCRLRPESGTVVHHPTLHALQLCQNLVGILHAHTTEVRDQVNAAGMAGKFALVAASRLAPTQRKHVTAVTTPVGTHVVESVEAMRNAMVDLLLVRVCFGV